jgi:adenylate kinase family enzyme
MTSRRVLVAGPSGSGKTALCQHLASRFNLPRIELDQLYYYRGWIAREDFAARVAQFATTSEWVTEWNYPEVQQMLLENAGVLIYLNYPRWLTYSSTVLRTIQRWLHKEVLWDGLVEPAPWRIFDADHILRTSWKSHRDCTNQLNRVTGAAHDGEIRVIAFRRPQDLSDWILAGFPGLFEAEMKERGKS